MRIFIALIVALFVFKPVSASAQQNSFDASIVSSNADTSDTTSVDILFSAGSARISGATVHITYPANIAEFVTSEKPSSACEAKNYGLNQTIGSKDDKNGTLTISKVRISSDKDLPTGTFCFGTLQFKKKKTFWWWLPWVARRGPVKLADFNKWELVGPNVKIDPATIQESSKTSATISR